MWFRCLHKHPCMLMSSFLFCKWRPDRYFCIIPFLFWCKILLEHNSHPDILEFLLLNSSLSRAQRFCDAIKRYTCCPAAGRRWDGSGMAPGCPGGQSSPFPGAAVTSAWHSDVRAQRTQSVPGSPCRTDMVPILQGMQSSAEHSTREGVQLPLLLQQPSQRAPPPVRNMPRSPTGRHGDDLCLWEPLLLSSLVLALQSRSSPPSQRLAPQGP